MTGANTPPFNRLRFTQDKVFVGNAGALRRGKNASNSHSIGDPASQSNTYKSILQKGDVALAQQRLAPKLSGGNEVAD